MHKPQIFLLAFLLIGFAYLHAQDTLPNMNFENWTSYGGGAYEEPSGGVWTTANKAVLLTSLIPVSTEKTTDAYSGTYAAMMTTKMASPPVSMLITGSLATGTFNELETPPNNMHLGMPFTGRPERFVGFYKYENNNGDSCDIYAILSYWDGSARQEIARAALRSTQTVTVYTKFNLPFNYTLPNTPDSISVVFASSAGGAQMVGNVGSTLYIDSTGFVYPSGIHEVSPDPLLVNCYPVPASNTLYFLLNKIVDDGMLLIFNEAGSTVKSLAVNSNNMVISLNNFASGKYYYQFTEKNKIIHSGNFVVN